MTEAVKSPIIRNVDAKLIRDIDSKEIISLYREKVRIDVSRFFLNLPKVSVYECPVTKYRFYYPFSVEGDALFYDELSKKEWYYHEERWEHRVVCDLVKKNESILEVGAGFGNFLKMIQDKGAKCVGLELNASAEEEGRKKGLDIRNEDVRNYSQGFPEKHDIVCSFQVLEHVSGVFEFLSSKINCLKRGGRLIISVPNNSSFVGRNQHSSRCLNLPPHHVGLWTPESLENLETQFGIKLQSIELEPLVEESQVDIHFWNSLYEIFNNDLFPRIIWKLKLHKVFRSFISSKSPGHSVLAIFAKV